MPVFSFSFFLSPLFLLLVKIPISSYYSLLIRSIGKPENDARSQCKQRYQKIILILILSLSQSSSFGRVIDRII